MWDTPISKLFRWLIYLPITFLLLTIIDVVFSWAISSIFSFNLSPFWIGLILIFLAGFVIILIRYIAVLLPTFLYKISPNIKIGSFIYIFCIVVYSLFVIYKFWTPDRENIEKITVRLLFQSAFIIFIAGKLIAVAKHIGEYDD